MTTPASSAEFLPNALWHQRLFPGSWQPDNAVVLKPDLRTAVCGGLVIARLFELAGLPKGVLHVLPGGADAGAALTSDRNIAMIQFTGSTGAGRKVGDAGGKHLKKVSLELGGKNSLIVLD